MSAQSCSLRRQKHFPQCNGVVMNLVAGRIYERDYTFSRKFSKFVELFRVRIDLSAIPITEFLPAVGIMSEPLPQLGAGSNVFGPMIDSGVYFCHAAWPEAVDQNPRAVTFGASFVGAFEPDMCCRYLGCQRQCSKLI